MKGPAMAIVLADVTHEIISKGNFTYRNFWTPTGEPYDFTFHVDHAVFAAALAYVRTIENDDDLVALARSVDITTSLVLEMLDRAKAAYLSMNMLEAGAMLGILVSMLRVLTTPNPSPEELKAMLG
jgi:hypothetical protein